MTRSKIIDTLRARFGGSNTTISITPITTPQEPSTMSTQQFPLGFPSPSNMRVGTALLPHDVACDDTNIWHVAFEVVPTDATAPAVDPVTNTPCMSLNRLELFNTLMLRIDKDWPVGEGAAVAAPCGATVWKHPSITLTGLLKLARQCGLRVSSAKFHKAKNCRPGRNR